ncbi:MAG: hypothetical protein NVSMB19_20690 [Vulcanimicrobiaceae bacterium]
MTEDQVSAYVGQVVTASLRDGSTVTGRLHGRNSTLELPTPYAIEYASPQVDTAYTDNRYHPISAAGDIVSLEQAR